MKKILIINLRRLGDVYSSAHLVSSLVASGDTKVSTLVYQESMKAAKSLKNITSIHTINRHDIITLKTNKLFADVDALSELFSSLEEVKSQEWDQVINYSNDTVGTYLTSYLQNSTNTIAGIYYDKSHRSVLNNKWSLLFNDIITGVTHSPIHFVDCYHKMCNVPVKFGGTKITTQTAVGLLTQKRLSLVREEQTLTGKMAKIVGIQLKTANASKDLPVELVSDFIFLLKKNPGMVPILIIAPNDQERARAKMINENFSVQIPTIESDLATLPAILSSMDLLVTPDTAIKHIADLVNTPVLEVSLGTSPFLKQGTYSENSYVLTDAIENRNYSEENQTSITAMDVMSSVFYFFTDSKFEKPALSENVTLYTSRFDSLGVHYYPVTGTVNPKIEISRLMNRQLVSIVFQATQIDELYLDAKKYGQWTVTKWAETEKIQVTKFMRDLLSTMRTLIQNRNRKHNSMEFVQNLGKLLNHANTSELTQIPCLLFKGKLELIRGTTIEENSREVEILLHELKSNILKVLFIINQLEAPTQEILKPVINKIASEPTL